MLSKASDNFKFVISAVLTVCFSLPVLAVGEIERIEDFSDVRENGNEIIELKIDSDNIENRTLNDEKNTRKSWGTPDGTILDCFRNSGYSFETGPIKSQKFRYYFHGGVNWTAQVHEDLSSYTEMAANEFQSETLFADGKTSFKFAYNFTKHIDDANRFFQRFSGLTISHRFNDNQNLDIGQTRVPVGYEGGIPSYNIKMFMRSQIARNFGNYYSTGIKNTADYKYGYYNIGFYDASRSFRNNFKGYEVAALGGIKPLAKFGDKYGTLKIGGSIDNGNSDNSFTVVGGHILYNYKKFSFDTEYLYADGFSGNHYGRGRAHGFYTTAGYFIHPKVEVLGRYDFFQNLSTDVVTQEYSAGVNYYISPKVKLMFQYILAARDTAVNPSHKIYLGADFTTSDILDVLYSR